MREPAAVANGGQNASLFLAEAQAEETAGRDPYAAMVTL